MKSTRIILLGLILAAGLMVPLAYAINFIGAINYVASHGGNVTFAQNFQAYSLTYPDGLSRFTNLIWAGNPQGSLGFDVSAGANMSITSIAMNQISYTVTGAGPITTYIYTDRGEPTGSTGTTTLTYNPATQITTITSPAGAIAVRWDAVVIPPGVVSRLNMVILFMAITPVVAAGVYVVAALTGKAPKLSPRAIIVLVFLMCVLGLLVGALMQSLT